jgi:thiamine monophosphate kinase
VKLPFSTVSGAESRLEELKALRRVLAAHIDNPDTLARDLAALSRQLRDVSKEIEELEPPEDEVSADDDDAGTSDAPFRLEAI